MERSNEHERIENSCVELISLVFPPRLVQKAGGFLPEFTTTERGRSPLEWFPRWPMVVLLRIGGKCSPFESGTILVIQAHQQVVLKIFIRFRRTFLSPLHSSAITRSPKVSQSPRDAQRVRLSVLYG
ncbi:MAG: hypothetical protein AUF64_02565 [Chloroflexi bacterium 13_1_20CM_54_36]|nr:MAG: hypothetical protein AUI01_12370 [Ktedonobacter sp. 13_2_20CM_2_56_8]OLD84198.1 MAG: hypothetical protein AUF64_02565 [Chloroflexi bacterium 13_1_20CM_54_36]OLE02644.1 MAG: hypothetical protein AUG82_07845 [Ktedonobacter sp. 13_1_20CM_4_53_11]OLE34991.1 MAG: hypothetical protein AUG45_02745 [Ktedonobacter sp. 13_1_20CM_3_54_15]